MKRLLLLLGVVVAYLVVGWLLIQIALQVFPFLDIPNWATRLVVLLVAIGLRSESG